MGIRLKTNWEREQVFIVLFKEWEEKKKKKKIKKRYFWVHYPALLADHFQGKLVKPTGGPLS